MIHTLIGKTRFANVWAPQEQIRAGLVKTQSGEYLVRSGLGHDIVVSERFRVSSWAMVGQTSARTLSPQGGVYVTP